MPPGEDSTSLPISVVIPVYNRADKLPRALDSIAAQRPRPPAEVIVVDDCSADDSAAVAEAAGVRVVRHEVNRGEAASDNDGVAAATQPWIAFLDSDDAWTPNCLDSLWRLHGGHVAVGGKSLAVRESDGATRVGPPPVGGRPEVISSPSELIFPEPRIAASGMIARRDAVLAAGGFDTSIRQAVDLDFLIRLLEQGTAAVSPDVVTLYYVHEGQRSSDVEDTRRAAERVITSYADRPWWSDEAFERWQAVVRWDALRRTLDERGPGAALPEAGWFLREPARARALAELMRLRLNARRHSSRLGPEGGPTVALLPNGDVPEPPAGADRVVDLSDRSLPAALLELARRPTARAVAASPVQAQLVRLLGIEPVGAD